MGKKSHFILFMVLMMAFFLAVMMGINRSFSLLGNDFTVPEDTGSREYALYPLEGQNGTYVLHIQNPQRHDAVLVLAAMRPFTAEVNGTVAETYDKKSSYVRLHVIPLQVSGEGETEVVLRSENGQKWLKALLTSTQTYESSYGRALIVNCICIGIHLMMLFNCLTLYLQKPTEKYLLVQLAATVISLISACLTCGLTMPVSEGAYVKLQYVVDSLLTVVWSGLCILLAGQGELPEKMSWRKALGIMTGAFGVLLIFTAGHLYWISESMGWIIFAVSLFCMGKAYGKGIPWMRLLGVGYVFLTILGTYNQMSNLGILPNTGTQVYFYTPQMGNLLFLSVCMMIVNHRFAQKFSEAERLVACLEETNRSLDEKVEKRTCQLKEQQRQRHAMMVNIFHDLRSPIFSARGCADMMQGADDEERECLQIIREKLDFLGQLTEQLFLVAKLEDGKITFAESRVDMTALCRHIGQAFQKEAEEKEICFELREESGVTVIGDAFRLRQAIENLLQNALRFTPAKGRIALGLSSDEGKVTVTVEDTGKGIAPEELPHVFERYYYGKYSDGHQSTGLGLSIASEIVKAHAGQIEAGSIQGRGSTFRITLPAGDERNNKM